MQCKSFVSAVVASALLAGYAWADNEGVSDEKSKRVQLRSVTTATGFKQDIKEAPASISIIPKEEILTRPIRDLGDAVKGVPGVEVSTTKTGDQTISMRGLGSAYTLILIDGKRQNASENLSDNGFGGWSSALIPPVEMIERIEVLRGPASVVWGSDAMGGVINIITKKNPNKFTANIMLETRIHEHNRNWQSDAGNRKYGSYGNMWGINGYLATPIIKDKLSLSVRGKYQDSGANLFYIPAGVQNNAGTMGVNPYTSHSPSSYSAWNAGGRLSWTPNEQNHIYLDVDYNTRDSGTLNSSRNKITSFSTNDKINAILSHDGKYSFGETKTYFQFMQNRRIPHTAAPQIGIDSGIKNYASLRENRHYIFDSKIHKMFDFGTAGLLKLNGGVYYLYETYKNRSDTTRGLLDQHQAAVYAEGEYTFNQYISTSLGLRYNYSNLYAGMPTPRFYVNINPTSWWTIKAGVANGYRVPGIHQLGNGYLWDSGTVAYYGNPNLQAEKSWNYELSTIFDITPGFITLTAFYTDFTDQLYQRQYTAANSSVTLPDGSVCTNMAECIYYDNVGKSLTRGVEASFEMNPFHGIGWNISYTFADSKKLTGDTAGNPVSYIARHTLNTRLSYKLNDFFDTYLRVQGKFMTPINAESNVGQYASARQMWGTYYKNFAIVDLGFNFHLRKDLTLSAVVNNLFDVDFGHIVALNNQYYANQYGAYMPGRNYWISLRYGF